VRPVKSATAGGSWHGPSRCDPGHDPLDTPGNPSGRGRPPSSTRCRAASSNRWRSSPTRPRASARSRTDPPRGRPTRPCSRFPIARTLTPARAANSSWDTSARSRNLRNSTPNPTGPGGPAGQADQPCGVSLLTVARPRPRAGHWTPPALAAATYAPWWAIGDVGVELSGDAGDVVRCPLGQLCPRCSRA
jgi:hypothetical protein